MRRVDGAVLTDLSAANDQVAFALEGGLYGISYAGTWDGGSATLEKLAADGSTYVTAATAFAANGFVAVNLSRGTYRVTVVTATGVYIGIDRIPGD